MSLELAHVRVCVGERDRITEGGKMKDRWRNVRPGRDAQGGGRGGIYTDEEDTLG